MKFSFNMPHVMRLKALTQPWEASVTGADQTVMAKRAEELGYDMIAIPEHFIVSNSHVELSGPHYFHSTVAQAYVAGATQRIRVNSCVTLLPLQHPIIMAKALSTADWMSSGRISVSFGVGWDAEEFKMLGVPFHERGRMADEYLAAIIELWTSDSPSFDGKYVSFKDVAFEPKPLQKPPSPRASSAIHAEPFLCPPIMFRDMDVPATSWMVSISHETGPADDRRLNAPSRDHPAVPERQNRCGCFEVGVIVDNGELVRSGQGRGQQVRHADGSMLARSCQCSLHAQRGLPMLIIGRQVLVGDPAVGPELLVLGRPAGTVECFSVQRRCRCDDTAFDQRPKTLRHLRVTHPGGGAGIDQITRDQRHTSPRSSGPAMPSIPPCSSHSIWRTRADVAAACCSAIRTVSETPVVLSSRCAAARRSSSRSINRLGTRVPSIPIYTN